ncbi:hypothetical protein EB061_06905 [bacterium]|jgi:hypothetical protein|nr:hypothetical protein [bacterium]
MRSYLRPILPVLAALMEIAATPARAETHWSGRIYTDQYMLTRETGSGALQQSSLSSWLDFDAQGEKGFGARAIAQGDLFLKSIPEPARAELKVRIREGYVSYLGPGLEIRAGQQIIPWGKSDGVNPTDYFSAKDYTLLNPDDEVRRLGAVAASVAFTPNGGESPLTFQWVLQGNFPQNRFLIPSSAIPAGLNFERDPSAPSLLGRNSIEVGGRISLLRASYDVSISVFSGFAHSPQYSVDSTLSVRPFHAPETAVGGDASFTVESLVFRMETALHMPSNGTAKDPMFGLVQPWHWDSVIGAERPIGNDFRAQLQFLYRWHPFFSTPVSGTGNPLVDQLRVAVGRANALILNYQRRSNPGATFRLAFAPESSDLSADLFLIGYFSQGQDFLLRPQIAYVPMTNLKLTAGADWYGGNPERPLGALRERSDLFFEARWLF